jgi:hypothetical protein
MNRGRLAGGLVCLALAVFLAVLAFALPEDEMVFRVGDTNVPALPAVILGVVGVVLVATAGIGRRSEQASALTELGTGPTPTPEGSAEGGAGAPEASEKVALNKRLEGMAWGLFLIMLGGSILVRGDAVPEGVWTIGVGVIMLGLNATRYAYGIKMSGFTTVLGLLAVGGGVAELAGVHDLGGAFLLIILGAYLLLKPWFEGSGLFGKAEEG